MKIRRFEKTDADRVSRMIIDTLRISNTKDYPEEVIEELIKRETPEDVIRRASRTHFYVAVEGESLVGCGAIGPWWDRTDESGLFTIFVHPAHQGKGVGKSIIRTLEEDEYFLRAKRVEIPASITGLPFYLKMGYTYKNGVTLPDEEGLYRLEKKR